MINGTDPDLITNRYCKVSADYLARIPFNLKEGTLIVAIVQAVNDIGISTPSEENTIEAK